MEVWIYRECYDDDNEVKLFATPCAAYSYARQQVISCLKDTDLLESALNELNESYKENMDDFYVEEICWVVKQKTEN